MSFNFITSFKIWKQFEKNLYPNFSPGLIFYKKKITTGEHQCNKQVQFANPGHKLTNKLTNRGDGQCERPADASLKPERNLAFSEGRKTCKQFCFKKFAQKQKIPEPLPQMKLQRLNTLNSI